MLFLLELHSTLSDKKIFVTNFPFLTGSLKSPDFQLNMLGDSIRIKNCVAMVLKKFVKHSKIAIFGPNLHKKGVNVDHAQLSETFYFIIYFVIYFG